MDHEHKFIASDKIGYEICAECGSYHSMILANPKELYENEYWNEKNGHSYFCDQIWNLTLDYKDGVSKVGKVLSYVSKPGTLLEIGCAPGVIMNRTRRKGFNVFGIEPDKSLIKDIAIIAGCDEGRIINGYFPNVKLPINEFDYIIAMDIVEHIEDYKSFIESVYQKLKPNGRFIMMSPIILKGEYRERDFCAHEHAWLFTFDYMKDFLKDIFQGLAFDRWTLGHELFICDKFIK